MARYNYRVDYNYDNFSNRLGFSHTYLDKISEKELGLRVRAIMGVPEEILDDTIISSPTFKISATRYINKQIEKYDEQKHRGQYN